MKPIMLFSASKSAITSTHLGPFGFLRVPEIHQERDNSRLVSSCSFIRHYRTACPKGIAAYLLEYDNVWMEGRLFFLLELDPVLGRRQPTSR